MRGGRSRTQPGARGGASCLYTFLRDAGHKEWTDGSHAVPVSGPAMLGGNPARAARAAAALGSDGFGRGPRGVPGLTVLSVSADLALRVRTTSGELPTCFSVVSSPRQHPGRQGTRGPSCSVSPTHGPRGGHTQGSSREGPRGVCCSCGRESRKTGQASPSGDREGHARARYPPWPRGEGSLGPLQARPPHQDLRGVWPSLAGGGPVCSVLPSPTPLLSERPPARSTAAVQTCAWWR